MFLLFGSIIMCCAYGDWWFEVLGGGFFLGGGRVRGGKCVDSGIESAGVCLRLFSMQEDLETVC